MVLVETKAESVASSPLSLANSKDEKSTLSFSELLRGAKDSKDEKGIQNGSFVLSLGAEEKDLKPLGTIKPTTDKETLSTLLKNDDKVDLKIEDLKVLELNPKITQNISTKELKVLIADAKKFLKDKILDSVEYKKSELKDLPKTLRGLTQVAKKFGIDVSKISVEEVQSNVKVSTPIKSEEKVVQLSKLDEVKDNTKQKVVKETVTTDVEVEDVIEPKIKTTRVKNTKTQIDTDANQEIKDKTQTKESIKENIRVDDKKIELVKEVKSTPLFKAQEKVEHTTEQLVQTKQFKVEEKTPKTRADETLKLLLRGEKPTVTDTALNMTKDFSVATARVIAPSATTEVSKSIEQLLRGDNSNEVVKIDSSLTKDVDSFDVKVKEAKQMMKYLSQDVKTAIEDYKSPFTRIKVQLNPQKMGEVDLTVVQRGKNLHVNLSSNNTAINTLSMNVNELRTQLSNNGIQNATLNFSNGSQQGEQNSHQQQNRQNERQANEEYNYFENEEQNEEILSSLEIVVPAYA